MSWTCPFSTLKYCHFTCGDLDLHLIHGSWATQSCIQTAYRSVQRPTDRQTDYATPSKTRIKVLAFPELKMTEDPSYRHLRRVSETLIYGSCCLGRQFSFSLRITLTALDSDCGFCEKPFLLAASPYYVCYMEVLRVARSVCRTQS